MTIIKINGSESVADAIRQDEPLMAVISFDGSKAFVSHLDDGGEHHILLQKAGQPSTDIDKYFPDRCFLFFVKLCHFIPPPLLKAGRDRSPGKRRTL